MPKNNTNVIIQFKLEKKKRNNPYIPPIPELKLDE